MRGRDFPLISATSMAFSMESKFAWEGWVEKESNRLSSINSLPYSFVSGHRPYESNSIQCEEIGLKKKLGWTRHFLISQCPVLPEPTRMILLLFLSKRITVLLVFPMIRAISSIVIWPSVFMASMILSSSVCLTGTFAGTFAGTSPLLNPLLSNGDRRGYRGRAETKGFLAVFPDDLGDAVPHLLDDGAPEEDFHELLVHRMGLADEGSAPWSRCATILRRKRTRVYH